MATPPSYTYSGVVYVGDGSKTEFALTSTAGKAIGYLLPEHISVSTSDDDGSTWTKLNYSTDYTFSTQGTRVVLTTAPLVDVWVRLLRSTPLDDNWVDYQSGNLLTAGQLNEFETWQLYIDQELFDGGAGGTGGGGGTISTTDDLPEGVKNLYYTDTRVETYVSGAGYIKDAGVSKIVAGPNIILAPSSGEGIVTVSSVGAGAFSYMGLIDATGPAPSTPRNGDLYVNTTAGTADASWAGIGGDPLAGNERLIWGSATATWGMITDIGIPEAPSNGEYYARKDQKWEPVVQSDWSEADATSFAFIKNKPTIPADQNLQSVCDIGSVTTTTIQAAGFRIDQLNPLPTT